MKAAILNNDFDIRAGEVPEPRLPDDHVILRSEYAGICGTDLHVYRGEFHKRVSYPAVLGHEFSGTIVEVGKKVRGFALDERVVVDPILSCYQCPACLTGHINACVSLKLLGIDLAGGFSQYVAVPADRLYRLPEEIASDQAPMIELYAVGHHILRRGRVQPGEQVAIIGAGRLGLSILDVLSHGTSPGRTIVVDVQNHRLQVARTLGADITINARDDDPVERVLERTGGLGVDCVIEAVGHFEEVEGREAPLAQAVRMVRNGGRIVTAGLGEQKSSIHFKTLVLKEADLIASRVTLGEFPWAIRLMSKGLLHPALLISRQIPAGEVTAAFHLVDEEKPDVLKVVLNTQEW